VVLINSGHCGVLNPTLSTLQTQNRSQRGTSE
jgi:hypothetical protein